MKSKKIFPESERIRLLSIIRAGHNEHCAIMDMCLEAILAAEEELQEKQDRISGFINLVSKQDIEKDIQILEKNELIERLKNKIIEIVMNDKILPDLNF